MDQTVAMENERRIWDQIREKGQNRGNEVFGISGITWSKGHPDAGAAVTEITHEHGFSPYHWVRVFC